MTGALGKIRLSNLQLLQGSQKKKQLVGDESEYIDRTVSIVL
jgi:hypothetical protein